MAILADANCDSLDGWTIIGNTSLFACELEPFSGNYSTSGAIALRYNSRSWASSSQYKGIKQTITLPSNYKITVKVNCICDFLGELDFLYGVFQIHWNGSIVYSTPLDGIDWGSPDGEGRIWDANNDEWDAVDWIQKDILIDLSSYAGQTGDLEFRLTSSLTDTGGGHTKYFWMNIDNISESYTQLPSSDWYVTPTGAGAKNGYDWDNAMDTIDQAMDEVVAGGTVHIAFGTYNSEPTNNRLSPDASDVTVIYETADTGGGSGTSTVEINR